MHRGRGPERLDDRAPQRDRPRTRILAALGAAVLASGAAAGAAFGQVIEIQPDGSRAVYDGPVQMVDGVVRPIAIPAPPPSARIATLQGLPGLIRDAASRSALSDQLVAAVAWQESRMRQSAVSPKGARGVMQLRPQTAAALHVDARDLRGNLNGGAAYLAELMREFKGDIILSLAAYNAGPEAVRRWGGVPPYPETRAYVAAVLDRLAATSAKPLPTAP